MKRNCSLLTCILIICINLNGQTSVPDSLRKIAATVSKDSAAKLYVKIANVFTGGNSDSVRTYARAAFALTDIQSPTRGDVFIQLGNSYHMENKVDSALHYYNKALLHFQKIGNEKGIGKVYQSFGIVKRTLGDILGAIEDNKKALDIYLKIKWDPGIVNMYSNISASYLRLEKYDDAIRYSRMALSRSKVLNDSLKYYSLMAEYGARLGRSAKRDSALIYLKRSSSYLEKNQMYNLLVSAYSNIAALFLYGKNPDLAAARGALFTAMKYSVASGATDNLRFIYTDFSQLYIQLGKTDSASFYVRKAINFIDSLALQRGGEAAKEIETKYETEKKELLLQKQALQIEVKQKESETKNRQLLFGAIALLAIAVFGFFAFMNYLKVKRFNTIVNNQKREVEDQKEKISIQKQLIETKQKEIIDSITYAQRIQRAVLTGPEVWNKISADYFILFKPKDIVSGDFYWAYNGPENISVFALADCTGHGVPGGFMSMLGNSFLNEIIVDDKIYHAAEILNLLRKKIISALEQEGATGQRDGMDMSICLWNKQSGTVEYAGANNSLLICNKNGITEIKADRMPVGTHTGELLPFTSHEIIPQPGDMIYLITDGFADQFGGPHEKKFSNKQLKDLLSQINQKSALVQKETLEEKLRDWQKEFEQVDDITIIGLRV